MGGEVMPCPTDDDLLWYYERRVTCYFGYCASFNQQRDWLQWLAEHQGLNFEEIEAGRSRPASNGVGWLLTFPFKLAGRWKGPVGRAEAEAIANTYHVDAELVAQELNARGYAVETRESARGETRPETNHRSIGPRTRFRVFERDGYRCAYCGRHREDLGAGESLVVDHIIPVSRSGTCDPDNLITACNTCNAGKANQETARFQGR